MTVPTDDSSTKKQWVHLRRILERAGPFKDPSFEPSTEVYNYNQYCTIIRNY